MQQRVIDDFEKQNTFQIIRVITVKGLKNFDSYLEDLKEIDDMECVIIGSGDGTIVAVFNALKDRPDIVYGFLPLGTSNTFVRSLGLPLSYQPAKAVLMKQHTQTVPLGAVNGVLFANIAGIGVPVRVTRNVSNRLKRRLGPLAYVVHGVRAIVVYKAFFCHISNDEMSEGFYTHHLLLANGPYHGPVRLKKDMQVFDNQLVLVAIGASESRSRYIRSIFSVLFRLHEKDPYVRIIPFKRALLTTQPTRSIEADGELIGRTPATIEIVQDAVRVFIQPPKQKTARSDRRRNNHR